MSRLPQPGGDSGNWGDILNDYLLVEHNADGTAKIRSDGTLSGLYTKPGTGIPESDLSAGVQTKLNSAGGDAVASVAGRTGTVVLDENDITNLSADLAAKADAADVAGKADAVDLTNHIGNTTSVHGIADTSLLATTSQVNAKYTKPGSGIPASDLDSAAQVALSTAAARDAAKLQGTNINSSAPSDGQVLQYSIGSSAWVPATVTPTGSVSDATTGVKGIIQLSGDLAGSATSPTVPGLATKVNISAVGTANGVASLDGSGKVPSAQLPAGSLTPDATTTATGSVQLAGDLAGTASAPTVAKVNGVAVTGTAASGKVISATSATAAAWTTLTKASVGLGSVVNIDSTNAANITAGTLPAGRLPGFTGDVTTTAGASVTTLANTSVTAGTYSNANITVDAKGRLTSAANGSAGAADATTTVKGSVQLAGDLAGTAAVPSVAKIKGVSLSATAPTVGQYLAATSGTAAAWQSIALGDVSGLTAALSAKLDTTARGAASGVASLDSTTKIPVAQLPDASGVTPGAYTNANVTVDAKGRVTAVANGAAGGGGGLTFNFVSKSDADAAYTTSSYDFVLADATGAPFNVRLPAPSANAFVRVKKIDSTSNTVSVLRTG